MVHVILFASIGSSVCFEKSNLTLGVSGNGFSQSPLPAMGRPSENGTEHQLCTLLTVRWVTLNKVLEKYLKKKKKTEKKKKKIKFNLLIV